MVKAGGGSQRWGLAVAATGGGSNWRQ